MALSINDIFPCFNQNDRILEPHKCVSYPTYPSIVNESDARVIYRRRVSKGSQIFQYQYRDLMRWEYNLIRNFHKRKKGRYEDFYLVDWASQYAIVGTGTLTFTLDSVTGLTDKSGFVGNTLLLYNPRFDPQATTPVTDKNILTINSGGITGTTITITKNQPLRTHLDTKESKIYILVPAIFDSDGLMPEIGDACIDVKTEYFPGYGNKSLFGPTYSINIGFTQLGVLADA